MIQYIVLTPLRHDGTAYAPDQTIALPEDIGQPLVEAEVLTLPVEVPALLIDPDPDALWLINSAVTHEELIRLPGIGAVSAGLIFAGRPDDGFKSLEDVSRTGDLPSSINWMAVADWEAD